MSLPLRLKTQVRDLWTSSDSQVQQSFQSLQKLIGKPIDCDADWPLLWNTLQSSFKDASTFVPIVAATVTAWCNALEEIANEEKNEDWLEKMLEGIGANVRVILAVADNKPTTKWLQTERGFEICFPKTSSSPHSLSSTMTAALHADLLQAFSPAARPSALTGAGTAPAPATESWTDVADGTASDFDTASIMTPLTHRDTIPMRSTPVPSRLPHVNMLPRPEELLAKPPYFLTIRGHSRKLTVECSHPQSLELLVEYLKKWIKRNHNLSTKPEMLDFVHRPSCFGLGTLHDRVDIEVPNANDRWTEFTPMLVFAFVHTVLGYELTYQDESSFRYIRHVPFQ